MLILIKNCKICGWELFQILLWRHFKEVLWSIMDTKNESMFDRRQQQLVIRNYFYHKNLFLMWVLSSTYFTWLLNTILIVTSNRLPSLLLINSISNENEEKYWMFCGRAVIKPAVPYKVSEALKYSMWPLILILALSNSQGNGCMKLSVSKNINFQPADDNVTQWYNVTNNTCGK